jgi:glycosyltransferase involved in cell wall biosynthesis
LSIALDIPAFTKASRRALMIIVHVVTRLLNAGSEENTLATCCAQRAAGHNVVLVHGQEWDVKMRQKFAVVADVICVEDMVHPISPFEDARAVLALKKLFAMVRADVVHTHQSKAGILGRVAAKAAGVPRIVHGVHILPFVNVSPARRLTYLAAERLCAGFTDAFISVSPTMRDICIAHHIGAPGKHFVALSAMDVNLFKAARAPADWRAVLKVPEGHAKPPTAVMLASFEPRKRHLELIRSLPDAFSRLPDWRLLFAGEGETEEDARALVEAMGLSNNVRFAGYRKDPEAIVAMADVCLLTSEREGLPRVLVQYAAAGKPCVVSHVPGVEDVVSDRVNAIITPIDDVAAAAQETANLLCDPTRRKALAAATRSIDVDAWSTERMAAMIKDAYAGAQIASAPAPRARAMQSVH